MQCQASCLLIIVLGQHYQQPVRCCDVIPPEVLLVIARQILMFRDHRAVYRTPSELLIGSWTVL